MRIFNWLVATGLGSGFSPIAPGTAGSLVAVIIAYFLLPTRPVMLPLLSVIFFFVGTHAAFFVAQEVGKEDPQIVVIDEVVGMWIALWMVPHSLFAYSIAFLAFRLFDIWKPFPIKRLEAVPLGFGIMLDDVIAGFYGLIVTQLLVMVLN